jgi:naringenin degradation protein FdeH
MPRPRHAVTGHNEQGRSIIGSDGPAPNVTAPASLPAMKASVMWVTDRSPASTDGNEDTPPAERQPK